MIALLAFVLFFLGATVKGVMGLGLPMIAIPVLTLIVGLPETLAITTLPVAAANLWQVWQFRACRRDVPAVIRFLPAGIVGTAAGTWMLSALAPAYLEAGLSLIILVYMGLRLTRSQFAISRPAGTRVAPGVGLCAGLLHGATGISGPIGITFFHAMNLARVEFIFATGAMFLVFSLVQATMLGATGVLTVHAVLTGLCSLPAVALGLFSGNRIARHVDHRLFDRLVLAILGFTAIVLMWRALEVLFQAA